MPQTFKGSMHMQKSHKKSKHMAHLNKKFKRKMNRQNSLTKSKHIDRLIKLEQVFKDKLKAMGIKPAVGIIRDINLTHAQKSTLQLVLLKMLLLNTNKAVSMAKEYSEEYGISLDSKKKKNPSKARTIGRSRHGQIKKKKQTNSVPKKITNKIKRDGKYYIPFPSERGQLPEIGQLQLAASFR